MSTIHEGHRKRVRERFRSEGLEAFAPHEVLELLLFYGRARGDTNGLAHERLARFGSLRGVLEASAEQLAEVGGVGEETATLLSLAVPLFRRYQLCLCEERKRISSTREAEEWCAALLAGLRSERFYLISLSAGGRVLGSRLIAEGTLSEVPAYPRRCVEAALSHNAHSVLLCHNHPGGACSPSQADLDATRLMQRLLRDIGISLLDHIIVADGDTYSFAGHGLLREEPPRAGDADKTRRAAAKRE